MNTARRRFLLATVIFLANRPLAARSVEDVDIVSKFTKAAVSWLTEMLADVGGLVEAANRHQLIQRLEDFREELYNLERDKFEFVRALERGQLRSDHFRATVIQLRGTVDATRSSLREVGLLLREQYQAGGHDVEQLLSLTTETRKDWLFNMSQDGVPSAQELEQSIVEGHAAVEGLRDASLALTSLIEKLKE